MGVGGVSKYRQGYTEFQNLTAFPEYYNELATTKVQEFDLGRPRKFLSLDMGDCRVCKV